MERIDLDQPRFTQAQVLQLVPALSAKDLQNWVQRGVLEVENPSPGRQGKRLYTGYGIIALAFMAHMTALGIGPKAAFSMAAQVVEHAVHVHEVYPVQFEQGKLPYVIVGGLIEIYHRGYIYKFKGEHVINIQKEPLSDLRVYFPEVYITVEVDFLVFRYLNRIYKFLAGEPINDKKFDPHGWNEGLVDALQAAVLDDSDDA